MAQIRLSEDWRPWRAAKRVVIAADRDEAKTGDGFKAGEKVANAPSAMKKSNSDWSDTYRSGGVEAVRTSIAAATEVEVAAEIAPTAI